MPVAVLAIDTSTKFAELALALDNKVITVRAKSPNSHIEKLAELFEELLSKSAVKSNSIKRIILGRGPGSFTGLRIGDGFNNKINGNRL